MGDLKTPKGHFEINWPLEGQNFSCTGFLANWCTKVCLCAKIKFLGKASEKNAQKKVWMLEKLDLQVKGSLPTLLSVKNEKLHMRVIVLNIYPSAMAKCFWTVKNIL